MRGRLLLALTLCSVGIGLGAYPAHAADLVWQVDNPFRFFKSSRSFAMYERAFDAARGNPAHALPADIIWRTERRLNDPDCKDATTPTTCAATARRHYELSRLGWASRTLGHVCYESGGDPRRYPVQCLRQYTWGQAREDYVLPEAHTVSVALSPAHLKAAGAGECTWLWRARSGIGPYEARKQPCKYKLIIARVPFSLNRAASGVSVKVRLPNGSELSEPNVVVEDLLITAFGDSFASGESNPDRPVVFSASREILYDPNMVREDIAMRSMKPKANYNTASANGVDPRVLPRRLMEDEEKDLMYRLTSSEFEQAFHAARARWLSADCHRSQYGWPFRVGLELTLENHHRAVTLMSFACSGAEVTEGLFLPLKAREGHPDYVRPQFDQLSDLICRGGAAGRTRQASYLMPDFSTGSTDIVMRRIDERWCPPERRKRPIDLVLMSIGGNDVGFGALATYSMTESASDLAPIAQLIGQAAPLFAGGGARLSRRARPPHGSREKGAARRLRRRAGTRGADRLRADPIRRDRQTVRHPADARHGRASQAPAQQHPHRRNRQLPARFPDAAAMHHQHQPLSRLPARFGDRLGHRFQPGHRALGQIHPARHLRARSKARDHGRHHDGHAAQAAERRGFLALFAGL